MKTIRAYIKKNIHHLITIKGDEEQMYNTSFEIDKEGFFQLRKHDISKTPFHQNLLSAGLMIKEAYMKDMASHQYYCYECKTYHYSSGDAQDIKSLFKTSTLQKIQVLSNKELKYLLS